MCVSAHRCACTRESTCVSVSVGLCAIVQCTYVWVCMTVQETEREGVSVNGCAHVRVWPW